jgi:hypothetical protein
MCCESAPPGAQAPRHATAKGPPENAQQTSELSQPSPLYTATRLDVSSVWDESNSRTPDGRIVCKPATGVPPERVRDQLTTVYGVYTTIYVALPGSLSATIRQWVETHQAEDLAASLTALETAIRDQPNHRY